MVERPQMKFRTWALGAVGCAASWFAVVAMTVVPAASQATLVPNAIQQFFDSNGNPISSGTVGMFQPGTTNPKTTWQDPGQTTPYSNPITLNAAGEPNNAAGIWGTGSYRQIVQDANGDIIWDAITSTSASTSPGTSGDGMPLGFVMPYAGATAPTGYDFAYGQAYSRSGFPLLLAAITITQSGSCTNGSANITGFTDTSQMGVGQPLESSCFPSNTTVGAVLSSTSVQASTTATGVTGTYSFQVFPFGNGNGSTTFNLPDLRGYVPAGRDNMGGTAASRLTAATKVGGWDYLGATGGVDALTLSTAQLPSHTHDVAIVDPQHQHLFVYQNPGTVTVGGGTNFATSISPTAGNSAVETQVASTGITATATSSGGGVSTGASLGSLPTSQGLVSATLSFGGVSYTNGTQVLTVQGGTCTTQPTVSTTVSGNVVTSINSIPTPGVCSVPPPQYTSLSDGSHATAIARITMGNGSGYTTGAQVLTVVGGTCSVAPQINVTVSGGSVVAVASVAVAGSCTVPPVNPVATTGGGGQGAVLDITYSTQPIANVQPTVTINYVIKVSANSGGFTIPIANNTVLGNFSGMTAPPVATTPGVVFNFVCGTRGALFEVGAGGAGCLFPGTPGYVLTSNGSGADPSYQPAPGSTAGTISGPGSSVLNDFVCWTNIAGTRVGDCGGGFGTSNTWSKLQTFSDGIASAITTSQPLVQTAISKLLSGPPASSGSSSLYNAISSAMINDTVQPNDGVSLFNENGGPYYGAVSSGVSTPQRGTVAALQLSHNVYDFADAPTVTGGEPTGISLVLNALTNKNNGSANYWLNDFVVSGPASSTSANREGLMVGYSLNIAKLTSGNALVYGTGTLQDKLGAWGLSVQNVVGLTQRFKSGSDTWVGQTSYPLNAGLVLSGYTGAYGTITDGYGVGATAAFNTAIQIGGSGGAYWNWGSGTATTFIASSSASTTMTVSAVLGTPLQAGNYLFGNACVPVGSPGPIYFTDVPSGGGAGTYTTNVATTCSSVSVSAGSGTPYHSYIQDGIDIQDHAGDAIHILARHPIGTGNAIVVDAAAGPSVFNSATTFTAAPTINFNTPSLYWFDTGGSTNGHYWRAVVGTGTWLLQAVSDDTITNVTAMSIARSGTTLGAMTIVPNTTFNGSVTVTTAFTATGLVTNADLVNASTTVNGQTCTLGSSCTVTAAAASIDAGGATSITNGASNDILFQTTGGKVGEIATANSSVLITSSGGVPSWATTLPSGLTAPGLTVTSSFTATGLVTNADLVNASTTVGGITCTLGSTCLGTATGTGNVVLATSPALVTPALGVAAGTSLALGGCSIGSNVLCTTGSVDFSGNVQLHGNSFFGSTTNGGLVVFYSTSFTNPTGDAFVMRGNGMNFQTNSATPSNLLDYNGTTASTWTFSTATTVNNATFKVTTLANSATTSAVCYTPATGLFTYNGTIGTCTISDETLKVFEGPVENALDRLVALSHNEHFGYFHANGAGRAQFGDARKIGLGAQTLGQFFPELVERGSNGLYSADYAKLTVPIIQGMATLSNRVDVLQVDYDNLHAELETLKQRIAR